ncbi:DUF2325 domain-containing protein [Rhodoferax sp. 4810]|nr:DUF2325 domain-containing protein [Rhodoferax jenense]
MCHPHPNQLRTPPTATSQPEDTPAAAPQAPSTGSRRRRLWELESRAHCPVVGICLPIPILRRVVNKVFRGHNVDTEYELHSGAVSQCSSRTPLSEGLQRELEQRYASALRQATRLKTPETLQVWWTESWKTDLPGTLWATLTHPRCSPELERQVLGEVHMLQHQLGAAQRADSQRLDALLNENAVLASELARAQTRNTQLSQDTASRTALQQTQVQQLRAELVSRNARLSVFQEQLQGLEAAVPDLACRFKQAQELALQTDRIHALERSLLLAQQESERRGRLIDAQAAELKRLANATGNQSDASTTEALKQTPLEDRSVLCVGGRTASVPLYRHIIERTGGRFLHHDGGEEESLSKLDATLATADLVICQTGCISHNAYWRVKDYCKRTGKQCVFVDNPGTACLKRALSELQQPSLS